jgi:hypothetical protein
MSDKAELDGELENKFREIIEGRMHLAMDNGKTFKEASLSASESISIIAHFLDAADLNEHKPLLFCWERARMKAIVNLAKQYNIV